MDRTGLFTNPRQESFPLNAAGTNSPSGALNGSTVNTMPTTAGQLMQPAPGVAETRRPPLQQHAVTPCGTENNHLTAPGHVPSMAMPGVNAARLHQEIYLARNHIQAHMDTHYPGKFLLTIPDDNATKVIAEFVAPFGWWQGAYYKIEFDFSSTDKHNKGPAVNVILAPPVAHLFGDELCLAQVIPHSAFPWFWRGEEASKYSSYNFDRVQQLMNVINFVIMDTHFWEEGEGLKTYPLSSYIIKSIKSLSYLSEAEKVTEINRYIPYLEKIASPDWPDTFKRHITDKIFEVNSKAVELNSSLSFDINKEKIHQSKSAQFSFTESMKIDVEGYKIYSTELMSDSVPVSLIIVEPGGEWGKQLASNRQVRISEHDTTQYHRADYFYPLQLDPQGRVAEFFLTPGKGFAISDQGTIKKVLTEYLPDANPDAPSSGDKEHDRNQNLYSLGLLKLGLDMKLMSILSGHHKLSGLYYNNKKIETDEELSEVINALQQNIKNKNSNTKNTNKLSCIFTKKKEKEEKEEVNRNPWIFNHHKWKASLKPTKTLAKASNLASQFKLTISQETPEKTQRYRNGMQWGVNANAWLPVIDRDMEKYEIIAAIKLLVDFAHKTLKLPNKREAITACDANNIMMKSMTMTMVDALAEQKNWLPSQCFLDLMINAINTHHQIGELYADMKHRNLKLLSNCLSGSLNKKNLKDFHF